MQGKKRGVRVGLLVSIVTCLLLSFSMMGYATDDSGQGEQSQRVTSNGTILFEETTTTTTTTKTTTSRSPQLPNAGGGGKKLPRTGEILQQGMVYGGLGLLLVAFVILFWKRRKKGEDQT